MKKLTLLVIGLFLCSLAFPHPGRTDGYGGHNCRKGGWGWTVGKYHYHSGQYAGYEVDYPGQVPTGYNKNPKEGSLSSIDWEASSKTKSIDGKASSIKKSTVKAVQAKLNKLEYRCGIADGVIGLKTKTAILEYQKNNGLTETGKVDDELLKALGIE